MNFFMMNSLSGTVLMANNQWIGENPIYS